MPHRFQGAFMTECFAFFYEKASFVFGSQRGMMAMLPFHVWKEPGLGR
jgi:hypothetical protein